MAPLATDVTLIGTLTDDQGTLLNGTLTFTLNGFGSTVPRINGTQMLPGTSFSVSVTSGVFSTTFYSNQIITPGPLVTFYNLSFQQSTSSVNQIFNFAQSYQFSPGSFDLSQLTPLGAAIPNTSLPNTVTPHTFAAVTSQFLNSFTSSGNFTAAQPVFTDLSGSTGFGNGSAGTTVTTTTKNTGTGPTTPQTVVKYVQVSLGGSTFWIPLVQ